MINVLIRVHNESIWLPQILRSLAMQEGVLIRNILLLDNRSNDNPEKVIHQFPDLNIIYRKYDKEYLPGEMLNYGINEFKKFINKEEISKDFLKPQRI